MNNPINGALILYVVLFSLIILNKKDKILDKRYKINCLLPIIIVAFSVLCYYLAILATRIKIV